MKPYSLSSFSASAVLDAYCGYHQNPLLGCSWISDVNVRQKLRDMEFPAARRECENSKLSWFLGENARFFFCVACAFAVPVLLRGANLLKK